MSVDSIETVTEDFFFDNDFAQPCNETAASPFGKVFLPILYSLVFVVGFTGVSFCKCVLISFLAIFMAFVMLSLKPLFTAGKTPKSKKNLHCFLYE